MFEVRNEKGIQHTGIVKYRRGLFQGDALSPLMFCLSIVPISVALERFQGIEVGGSCASLEIAHVL